MNKNLVRFAFVGVLAFSSYLWAEDAAPEVFLLKNGDKITAIQQTVTETNIVVLTSFGANLTIPLDQIVERSPAVVDPEDTAEKVPAPVEEPKTEAATPTSAPEATEAVVEEKKVPETFAGKFFSNFKPELQFGLEAGSGASDYLNYYGRVHATHGFERWNNIWDAKLTYGKNRGEIASDKLDTSYRLEYDVIQDKLFAYGNPTGGYDNVRAIDYFYTVGAGLGYHILKNAKTTLNFSAGASYQSYKYNGEDDLRDAMYVDFGENFTWNIVKNLDFVESVTFSPKAQDFAVFRVNFEAGLKWTFNKYINLNFTFIDKYDSHPAVTVSDKNDIQIVTSLGVKF